MAVWENSTNVAEIGGWRWWAWWQNFENFGGEVPKWWGVLPAPVTYNLRYPGILGENEHGQAIYKLSTENKPLVE